jgi:hypothetical protein
MHACWIFLCMSLNLVSYVFLLMEEGIGKSTKSKGGLEGSMPRPMGGWVCYSLVSELMVETLDWYGPSLFIRFSWLRSNFDCKVENLRKNGVVESMWELDHQRSVVRGSKDRDHSPSNSGVITTVGSREIQDRWI